MKLVKVTAIWCTSCILMNPIIEEVAKEYDMDLVSYDYDLDSEKFKKYDIGKILPVVIIEDENGERLRLVGEMSKKEMFKKVGELYE